ncbi:MAG: 4Fe-4S binding protein [Oscillospiraceae bacterium]|jgi:iron only hydrogenase large subunit-like protein|nr:4Fe-4S binding protein [Oscillospiraceae bacterium]
MSEFYHSVTLNSESCKGCNNCMKRCPTEAIRVRNGKAHIITERCIDCGECIRVCPNHAKQAVSDPLSRISDFPYSVALPAPAFFGQFKNLDSLDQVLTALKQIGFQDVFEVSRSAETVSRYTEQLMKSDRLNRPVISSACPAVTRLIRVRFPNLCRNVLPLLPPVEIAARMARREAVQKSGLNPEQIGIFFISPCPAKATYIHMPLGTEKSEIDGVLSINDVYLEIVGIISRIEHPEPLSQSSRIGVGWAGSGGEASVLPSDNYLAADGIENVIKVLSEIEDDKLDTLDFIELDACCGGCVGGVLTVENPYVAKSRIQKLLKTLPSSRQQHRDEVPSSALWTVPLEYVPVMKLHDDVATAMKMMKQIEDLVQEMPGLDCGSCGAPACRAFSEDVVRGLASRGDCIFKRREQVQRLVEELSSLENYLPPPFRKPEDEDGAEKED